MQYVSSIFSFIWFKLFEWLFILFLYIVSRRDTRFKSWFGLSWSRTVAQTSQKVCKKAMKI